MTDRESLNEIQKAFYDGYDKGYSEAEKKWTEMYLAILNDVGNPTWRIIQSWEEHIGYPKEEGSYFVVLEKPGGDVQWDHYSTERGFQIEEYGGRIFAWLDWKVPNPPKQGE